MRETIPSLVSTIIPAYNRPAMLREAVASVLAQTYRPIEIIVVDDGSTDETPRVGEELASRHSEVIFLREKHEGPGPTREAGRQAARGEFMQYLDSDDLLHPRKFEVQVKGLVEQPDCGVAYGRSRLIDVDRNVLADPFRWTDRKIPTLFPGLLVDRWWCTHTPLYRRSVCDAVGAWSDLRWSQDWEYDGRVGAMRIRLAACQELVSDHRQHAGVRQTSLANWRLPERLLNRTRFLKAMLAHAEQAGVAPGTAERNHFTRWVFSVARQCAAAGLADAAKECLDVAERSSGDSRQSRRWFSLFYASCRVLGLRRSGALFTYAERIKKPGRMTLANSESQTIRDRPDERKAINGGALDSIGNEAVSSLVSTIIPAYNRPDMLRDAVASVLAQTYRPIEVIVVDDGSTDDTPRVAEELARQHPEVVFLREKHAGPGPTREAGRLAARGEFIQYLDSDDLLRPCKFEVQVAALRENPRCGAAYGYICVHPFNRPPLERPFKGSGEKRETLFPWILADRWWNTNTPLFRRSVTDAVGPWSDLRWSQDWEYDGRVGSLGTRLVHCKEFVCDERHHAGPRQTSPADWLSPERLLSRKRFLELMLRHAERAGVSPETPQRKHFTRWIFATARQCAASGLTKASRECMELAERSAGDCAEARRYFSMFRALGFAVGTRRAGTIVRLAERLKAPGTLTLEQSFARDLK